MNAKKKYEQLKRKNSAILNSPADNPIWRDDDFWKNKWPVMVDREAEALERIIYEECQ